MITKGLDNFKPFYPLRQISKNFTFYTN